MQDPGKLQRLMRRPLSAAAVSSCLLFALGLLMLMAATPALATTHGFTAVGQVPDDVRAAFTGEELRKGVRTPETDAMSELRAGSIHQLFGYSETLFDGTATDTTVQPFDSWVAGIEGDGVPIGWLRVYKPDGVGPAQPTGWLADPQQGASMLASTQSAFIEVPSDGAFFTLTDGTVTPVIVSQWDQDLGPRSLVQVQQDFAVDRAEAEAACAEDGNCSDVGSPVDLSHPRVWGVGVVLVFIGGALWFSRRRRRNQAPAGGWS